MKFRNIHFMHIPKTGGSALKITFKTHNISVLEMHGHTFTLKDVKDTDGVVFSIREPISRFCSAFYSRQRQGRPLYNSKWSSIEEKIFTTFKEPDVFVKALSSNKLDLKKLAQSAFTSIGHFRSLSHWLINIEYIKLKQDSIVWILEQNSLNEDFSKLTKILHIDKEMTLPEGDARIHKNSISKYSLSEDSIAILQGVYRADYEIINYCKQIKKLLILNEYNFS